MKKLDEEQKPETKTDQPGDIMRAAMDGVIKHFHRAVFSMKRGPFDEEAMLLFFNHACAYCWQPFTPERCKRLDPIVSVMELGDPFALHNNVPACSRCKRSRNGSWVDGFMRQVLGPALGLDSDLIEERLLKIDEWINPYRPSTPEELFGEGVSLYKAQLEALKEIELGFAQLFMGIAQAQEDLPANLITGAHYEGRKKRIEAARARLRDRHQNDFRIVMGEHLSDLVIGPENRTAFEKVENFSDSATGYETPLYLYGETGVGKTAWGALLLKVLRGQKKYEITAEKFITGIDSDRKSFLGELLDTDALFFDDLEFLQGRPDASETLHRLVSIVLGKPVILAGDLPPNELAQSVPELRKILERAIAVQIAPPSRETRIRIVSAEAKKLDLPLDADIVEYIVNQCHPSNIREIVGAVVVISVFFKEEGWDTVTLERAKRAMGSEISLDFESKR